MALFNSKNMDSLSDAELVYRYQKTTNKRFVGELFNRYSHLVYGVALKYLKNTDEAKDIVMEVFEKLMTDLLKTDVKNFKAWLHIVSKNQCLMKLRKQNRAVGKEQSIETIEYSLEAQDQTEEKKLKEQQLTNLEAAIKQLKPEQQSCVELFYLQQKCYQEVADITGFSLKQVKSYIQNGKRNLKLILMKNEVAIQQ